MALLDRPGDLARTAFAAVLLEAIATRATGVLEVAHGGGTSRLWLREGQAVGAQVFTGSRPLGLMLLQSGRIDVDALSRSLAAMAATRRPQGEILVEMGVVSPEDVAAALTEQQAGYCGILAALEAGTFVFVAATAVPEWTRGVRLSGLRTLVDALERPQATPLVVPALQRVATSGVRLVRRGGAAGPDPWTDPERELVARLEGGVSLDDFFLPAAVSPERARAILAALLLTGAAGPASGGGGSPHRSDPAEAQARRQRLRAQGLRNLGVGPFAARAAEERPARAPAATPSAPPPPPRPIAALGAAEQELRDALLAMAPRARDPNLFARLAIPETAGRDEAKRAFLAIARQFHPDRFASAAFDDLQDTVRDFFAAVNEAYEVLSDDARRAAYRAERERAAAAGAGAARLDFQKGDACLRTRDYARARGFLEAAVRADPRAEYQAALALAWLADPARRDVARARRLLADATRDPACDRAHLVAGILARDEGDEIAAERCFRAAVRANPRNADAARELRHAEARRASRRG